jgi:hypothetical protein
MNRYRWRTTEDGMVLVAEPPAYVERAITLTEEQTRVIVKVEADWGELCREVAGPLGIPDGWLQAMIYRESGGNRRAFRQEPNGWTGVGLLQITHPSLKAGRTDAEVFIPHINVGIGARHVRGLIAKYGTDFPKVSAAFNAGSVRESEANPWGMVSTGAHVTSEVAALNSWILYQRAKMQAERDLPIAPPAIALIDLTELAREQDDAARQDTEPPSAA